MKRLIAALAFAALPAALFAQKADRRIERLLQEGDYFALQAELPALENRLGNPVLGCMAKGLVGTFFNRPSQALSALDSLLDFYPESLAGDTRADMETVRGVNLLSLGRYAEAADRISAFLDGADDPDKYAFSCGFVLRIGEALRKVPPGRLERPDREVRVPLRFEKSGRGEAMLVPVMLNGRQTDFIFDTGCSFYNFVTESFAAENGIAIVADSIPITGMGRGFVKLGTADSLLVGELVYRNPVFLIAPDDTITRLALLNGAVLGSDFIKAAGRMVFSPGEGTVTFPPTGNFSADRNPNMYLSGDQPYLRVVFRGQPLTVHFDTGNVKSNFGPVFYGKYGRWIGRRGVEDKTAYGGYGGMAELEVRRLPEVALKLDSQPFSLTNVEVTLKPVFDSDTVYDGSFGTDFVKAFDRLEVDYDRMRVTGYCSDPAADKAR